MIHSLRVVPRRPGDIATCYADPTKAAKVLQFQTTLTIEQACADAIRWQTQNPQGFATATNASK